MRSAVGAGRRELGRNAHFEAQPLPPHPGDRQSGADGPWTRAGAAFGKAALRGSGTEGLKGKPRSAPGEGVRSV